MLILKTCFIVQWSNKTLILLSNTMHNIHRRIYLFFFFLFSIKYISQIRHISLLKQYSRVLQSMPLYHKYLVHIAVFRHCHLSDAILIIVVQITNSCDWFCTGDYHELSRNAQKKLKPLVGSQSSNLFI